MFSAAELDGVPKEALATFARTDDGLYWNHHQIPGLHPGDAEREQRRDAQTAVRRLCQPAGGPEHPALLEEAICVRQQCAKELGYASGVDYRVDGRMAKSTGTVLAFLEGLKEPLKEKIRDDLATLIRLKKEQEPGSRPHRAVGLRVPDRAGTQAVVCA